MTTTTARPTYGHLSMDADPECPHRSEVIDWDDTHELRECGECGGADWFPRR